MTVEQQKIYRGELLQRWAKLVPDECEVDGDFVRYKPEAQGGFIESRFSFGAFLLAGLIHAIRNRQWHYTIESDETEPGVEPSCAWHNGYVMRDNKTFCYQAAEPCDCLLAAYITAIEGEA